MIQATGGNKAHSDTLSEPHNLAKWHQNHLAAASKTGGEKNSQQYQRMTQ